MTIDLKKRLSPQWLGCSTSQMSENAKHHADSRIHHVPKCDSTADSGDEVVCKLRRRRPHAVDERCREQEQ